MPVHKKGITVLHEGENPAIDIVFVHGFTGDPELTWTLKNAKQGVAGDHTVVPEPTAFGRSDSTSSKSTTIHKRLSEIDSGETSDHDRRPSKIRRLIPGRASREPQEHSNNLAIPLRRDVFWPQDLLPSTAPNARVLTYGYDTKIRHRFVGPVSQNTVTDHGWELLCALDDVRRDDPSRPLLFMAHSLGGLVLKIALMKSRDSNKVKPHLYNIMMSTVGVFFFGTPHRGADPLGPGIRRILTTLANGFGFQKNDRIIDTLMPGDEYLREVRDGFLELAKLRKWIIYSFQEEYGVGGLAGKKVVDDESSRLDEPAIETPRHISNNHMDMVRFTGIEDNEYRKVDSATRLVIHHLTSSSPALQNTGADPNLIVDQGRDQAMGVVLPVSPEKLQAREELMGLLHFDEIDARLLSLKVAHNSTCQWLLKKPKYRDWLDPQSMNDHHGFLWIKGKPGVGKSVLMKFLDNDARRMTTTNSGTVVISFFFNARGEQLERTTLGLYRSLLWQLLEKFEEIQAALDVFDTNAQRVIRKRGWQIEPLKQALANAVEHFKGKMQLRLFIDALDECSDDDVSDMVSFFEDLGETAAEHNINLRICFSSRYYPTITVNKGIEIKLDEEEEHSLDIVRYIKSQLKLGRSKRADELRTEILDKSKGIFLWVALVIPMLNKACAGGKVDRFRKCLDEYPTGLHELFEMIVARDEEDLDDFRLSIQWILFAMRPLKIEEYYFALGPADDDTTMYCWNNGDITQDHLQQFLSYSSKGFAEITKTRSKKNEPTVQFIHESVREFFLSKNSDGKRKLWPKVDGSTFATLCHNTLSTRCCEEIIRRGQDSISSLIPKSSALPTSSSEDGKALRQLVSKKLPFLEYATSYVFDHADAAAVDFPQEDFVQRFPFNAWLNVFNIFAKYNTRRYTELGGIGHILYEKKLTRLLKIMLARGIDIDRTAKARESRNLLSLAAIEGNEKVVKLLLDGGATVNVTHAYGGMALFEAAQAGHENIVKQLIEKGALIDSRDNFGSTPLTAAARSGHENIVKQLIEKGASVDSRDGSGRTPVMEAAEAGHKDIVKQLIEKGAESDSKDSRGKTPLQKASAGGYTETVKFLLEKGANANSKDSQGETPLSRTAEREIIELLLEKGAELDSRDLEGRTPLSNAAERGDKEIVKLLLEKGAEPNSRDLEFRTPLSRATEHSNKEVIEILLENGAEPNSRDLKGRTPLSRAAEHGIKKIVELLLDKGAELNSIDSLGRTPLSRAAEYGNTAVINLLLEKGAELNSRDIKSRTPLFRAVERGAKFTELSNGTPLFMVPEDENKEVIKLLLERGAEPDSGDLEGQTPLFRAVERGDEEIVKWLLERGAKGSLEGPLGWDYWLLDERVRIFALLQEHGIPFKLKGWEDL